MLGRQKTAASGTHPSPAAGAHAGGSTRESCMTTSSSGMVRPFGDVRSRCRIVDGDGLLIIGRCPVDENLLFRLDACAFDHLAPPFRVFSDQVRKTISLKHHDA